MSWIRNQPIAHRGLHSEKIPENSLKAFESAIDAGYAVELDVRLSSDNTPVVFHDKTLSRLTNTTGQIADHTWSELKELRLAGTSERIPRLQDVLDIVDGKEPLCIDIKNDNSPGEIEKAVIRVLDDYEGSFAIQSFNPDSLAVIRKMRPRWLRGQLASFSKGDNWYEKAVRKRMLRNWKSKPDFISYRHSDLPYLIVELYQKLGHPIIAWIIRTEKEFRRAKQYADNVVFENIRPPC